jgi:2-succinyl-5-enolpyruvyl-6-hydroxy-3-cyclohexene-1-carboxylate synthase
VEAYHSNLPLVLLTADRPPELRGTGANQTIQQPGLFGGFVRYAIDLPCAQDAQAMQKLGPLLSQALAVAQGLQPGPVHLNVPIREPLLVDAPTESAQLSVCSPASVAQKCDWPLGFDVSEFLSGRGIVVIGRLAVCDQSEVAAIFHLAKRLGWPLLADATSGARLMPGTLRHADWILSRTDVPAPDRVLHFGGPLVSKRVAKWLSNCRDNDCLQVRLYPDVLDPWQQRPTVIRAGIHPFCEALGRIELPPRESSWSDSLAAADEAVASVIESHLAGGELSEPAILRALADLAAETNWLVFLGNSMPIRDFDSCVAAVSNDVVNVFANRGASGIDGNIATVAGLALGCASPLLAVMGDLAALHDLNSLPLLHGLPVTLVIINNGGGGIFRFLPIDVEERLMETPHAWEFRGAAQQFGMEYHQVASLSELRALLAERHAAPRILECRTERGENHALHLRIAEACRALSFSWGD